MKFFYEKINQIEVFLWNNPPVWSLSVKILPKWTFSLWNFKKDKLFYENPHQRETQTDIICLRYVKFCITNSRRALYLSTWWISMRNFNRWYFAMIHFTNMTFFIKNFTSMKFFYENLTNTKYVHEKPKENLFYLWKKIQQREDFLWETSPM